MLTTLLLSLTVARADDCCTITRVRGGHRTVHTEIVIDAPPEAVWAVLTDWGQLDQWSPSIRGMEGDIRDGGQVVVDYVHPGNGKTLVLDHTLIYIEGQRFGWSDPMIGRVRDHHLFTVEALPDGRTRFTQDDEIKGGLLARLIGPGFSELMLSSYQAFNTALKTRVEGR